MTTDKKPTIKGIFINSHIKKVRQERGDEGVRELEKKFGMPLNFRNFEDVPVREEVHLIECALEVLEGNPIPDERKQFEAGRLHFKNFSQTPFGRIIFSQFRNNFKMLMMNTPNIAGHVFKDVRFYADELGPKEVRVTMENNDYPVDHFRGLFQEWMDFSGLKGTVEAQETAPNRFAYIMTWE